MRSNLNDTFSCLALYDWESPLSGQAEWISFILDFFQKFSIEPNIAVCCAGGKWSKPIKLQSLLSRIERGVLFESIELYLLSEDYQSMMDANAGAMYQDTGIAPQGKRTMVIAVPGNLNKNEEKLYELCKNIAQQCEIIYGIGYELPKSCGPIYYGLGIVQTSQDCTIEATEQEKIAIWFKERIGSRDAGPKNRHLIGKLRDVYPLNVLSDAHLNASVNGVSLKEWILTDSRRGILENLGSKSSLWKISLASIGKIRKNLSQEGLIICDLTKTAGK